MNQHRRYFDSIGVTGCPRDILRQDIRRLLHQWRQNGERIVVFIDANENVLEGAFHSMFTDPDLGMREAVVHRHPDPRWKRTGTYRKGDSIGSYPIDAVYVTPDLPAEASTWLQFIDPLGDHRFAVIDVKASTLVGENPLKVVRPPARRLSCAIPSAVDRYTALLNKHLARHKVLSQLHDLYLVRNGDFTTAQRRHLERLDRVRTEGMLFAEKKCRKLAMGLVAFSPEVDLARKRRALWKLVVKKRQGKRVSSSLIRRKARQLGISCPLSVTSIQAELRFQEADAAYDLIKRDAPSLRHEFLCDRASNKSGNVPREAQKAARRLLRQERQRSDARHLRRVLGRTQRGAMHHLKH
jgi:hypothetical protein